MPTCRDFDNSRGMIDAAIRQADERAAREQRDMVVYHAARDHWGRAGVFFVRPADNREGVPLCYCARQPSHLAETVYRTKLGEAAK